MGIPVNISHETDLPAFLCEGCLVNADGIDPEEIIRPRNPCILQNIRTTPIDKHQIPINQDFNLQINLPPGITERSETRGIIDLEINQGATNRRPRQEAEEAK